MALHNITIETRDCSKCEHRDPSAGKMQCRLDPEFGCYVSIRYKPDARPIRVRDKGNGGNTMRVPIHIAQSGRLEPAGYAEVSAFDAEELFNLCNWECYQKEKPTNLFSEIGSCGHGICFTDPVTNQKWLALSSGWYVTQNMQEIEEYVSQNAAKNVWIMKGAGT